jgi:ribosomal protein S18 acetylase RimI-like enzyme
MRFDDIPYAIRLTDQEEWGVTRKDLNRILTLDRQGSFVAVKGARRIGLITTTRYGERLAWIGNVIVDRKHRGEHIGQSLVQTALKHLQKSGVLHIALYCFNDNVKFYRRLRFVRDAPFARLRREPARHPPSPTGLRPHRKLPLVQLLSLDRRAFGADRSRLIRTVLRTKAGWYVGSPSAYLLVKESGGMCEIGPWVCSKLPTRQDAAMLRLALSRMAGKPIEVSCLREHPAYRLFRRMGFQLLSRGYRMYYQRVADVGMDEANFALGFLDKG